MPFIKLFAHANAVVGIGIPFVPSILPGTSPGYDTRTYLYLLPLGTTGTTLGSELPSSQHLDATCIILFISLVEQTVLPSETKFDFGREV